MPITLSQHLDLPRCPHCSVDRPNLNMVWNGDTRDHTGQIQRAWRVYACASCGGLVSAWALSHGSAVVGVYPEPATVDADLPPKAHSYLEQAHASIHAPAGAIMLAAAAVDAMLKSKDYKSGSLYDRIDKAAADHVITKDMAAWAHEVRLDANDQRHADESAPIPSQKDARRAVEFASAFGTFLFTLPARVQRGLKGEA